jgi:hypothetical protein
MDLFNFAKTIEQGVYDVMMWIFFYPYTLVRMVLRPVRTLAYVRAEAAKDPEDAFAGAMRPALFLMISIAVGTAIAPFNVGQIRELEATQLGRLVTQSWFALLLLRMIMFSLFPLVGAVLLTRISGGELTRHTMRTPFYQQSYIAAPFALIASPALVNLQNEGMPVVVLSGVTLVWFLLGQYLFFRQSGNTGVLMSATLALAVLFGGLALLVFFVALVF